MADSLTTTLSIATATTEPLAAAIARALDLVSDGSVIGVGAGNASSAFLRSLADRQATFDGRRIVIFSGGATDTDDAVFDQVRAIRDGGGFGSIIGRNSFQRRRPEALAFLKRIIELYSGAQK